MDIPIASLAVLLQWGSMLALRTQSISNGFTLEKHFAESFPLKTSGESHMFWFAALSPFTVLIYLFLIPVRFVLPFKFVSHAFACLRGSH